MTDARAWDSTRSSRRRQVFAAGNEQAEMDAVGRPDADRSMVRVLLGCGCFLQTDFLTVGKDEIDLFLFYAPDLGHHLEGNSRVISFMATECICLALSDGRRERLG